MVVAGAFDDDPGIKPDKHIFIEFIPASDDLRASLPACPLPDLYPLRTGSELPVNFQLRAHASAKSPNTAL